MKAAQEIWKSCVGFEGRYEVSDLGRVRSLISSKILKPRIHKQGYVSAMLYDATSKPANHFVHRLVSFAFIGNQPKDRKDVNHINGIKSDNRVSNLEWTNDSLNVTHAFRVLGHKKTITRPWLGKFGDDHHGSKSVIRFGKGEPEKRYASISQVEIDGFNFKHVSAVCRNQRKRHGGYFWRFEKGIEMIKSIRQGDVCLQKIDALPVGCVAVETEKNRIVLAYGEMTGHSHAIYEDIDQVKVWAINKVKYLEVMATVMLKHEEHSAATIEPGIYKLPVQVEYTPEELRITRD